MGVVGSMYFFPPYRFKAFKVIIMILAVLLQASVAFFFFPTMLITFLFAPETLETTFLSSYFIHII